jgi:hypothetical protein
LHLLVKQQKRK